MLFGKKFWENAVDFDWLVKTDVITKSDLGFFEYAETVEEAYNIITSKLEKMMNLRKV